ncbi:MAG: hypothetical protein C4341_07120 [Armatimonadota bacterium]
MANPQSTWARLEHVSGSRASLSAYDFGVLGLSVGKDNAAGQAMPPSATLGVASAGPSLTMGASRGNLIYHAGSPCRDGASRTCRRLISALGRGHRGKREGQDATVAGVFPA